MTMKVVFTGYDTAKIIIALAKQVANVSFNCLQKVLQQAGCESLSDDAIQLVKSKDYIELSLDNTNNGTSWYVVLEALSYESIKTTLTLYDKIVYELDQNKGK